MGVLEETHWKYTFRSEALRTAAMIRTSSSKLDRVKSAWKLFEAIWEDDFLGLEAIFVLGAMNVRVFMKDFEKEDEQLWSWRTGESIFREEKDLEDFENFKWMKEKWGKEKDIIPGFESVNGGKRKWIRVLSE